MQDTVAEELVRLLRDMSVQLTEQAKCHSRIERSLDGLQRVLLQRLPPPAAPQR